MPALEHRVSCAWARTERTRGNSPLGPAARHEKAFVRTAEPRRSR